MNITKILIAGAGEFGREAYQYLIDLTRNTKVTFEILGFLDDRPFDKNASHLPAPLLGTIQDYQPQEGQSVIVALGDPENRKTISQLILAKGGKLHTLIHPTAVIADSAVISAGCILCPFTFMGPNATLETGVLLNTYASAGHDSTVGAYSVLCPYAALNGKAKTGECVFLGTHASLSPRVSVGRWSKVSAGCNVPRDVPDGSLVAGHPPQSRVMFKVPS